MKCFIPSTNEQVDYHSHIKDVDADLNALEVKYISWDDEKFAEHSNEKDVLGKSENNLRLEDEKNASKEDSNLSGIKTTSNTFNFKGIIIF